MKGFSKEIKIALVSILGIIVLFFGLNFLKGITLFSTANGYKITFKDVSGLTPSSPIYADGYKVGVVRAIHYDYEKQGDILVETDINPDMRIPKGSSAEIVSDLLGNVKINLLLANNPRERVSPGEIVVGNINDGAMGKMKDMIPMVEKMLPKLDSIMGHLNTLLANPAIAQSINNMETTTGHLSNSTNELNTLLSNLNKELPMTMAKLNGALDNTSQLTANLAQADINATMNKINGTMSNVQQLTDKINNSKGTLGLLINDASLYKSLESTVKHADSLVINLREHPKRYVHFSVFGKKDK